MKVLILSATTGAGHMRTSQALKKYICKNEKSSDVKIIDAFKYISPFLDKTINDGYEKLIKKAPKIWASIYNNSNNEEKKISVFLERFIDFISKKLLPTFDDFDPDIVISTHPFTSKIISRIKSTGKVQIPHMCILTDYYPHLVWINEYVDSFIVAHKGMIDVMEKMGATRGKIHPFGIPVDMSFYVECDKNVLIKELNIDAKLSVLLIMAGSFGVSDVLSVYDDIVKINLPFQIIVITGKNKRLYKAFEKRLHSCSKSKRRLVKFKKRHSSKNLRFVSNSFKSNKQTKLVYFTEEVDKYMKVSDLIVTKPGGLTVSEALACNLPMAIFDAIPGQEEENAEFLLNNDMAVKIEKGKSCEKNIEKLLTDTTRLEKMKSNCIAFDRSSTNENILSEIKRLIEKN